MYIQRKIDQRYIVNRELKRVIQQIQRLPEFNRFLRVLFENELMIAANDDSIVIINVSDYRCNTLIIENIKIQVLRLSYLYANDIRNCIQAFAIESLTKLKIFEWLWNILARLVLDIFEFIQTSSNNYWPHISWIFTKFLIKFLIHAARRHF